MSSSITPPTPTSPTYTSLPTHYLSPRATTLSDYPTHRPWIEFFTLNSFTRPYSFNEAIHRIKRNLNHFRVNYTTIILLILFLSLLWHPLSLIVFLAVFAAWFFLFFFRDRPIVILRRTLDDRLILTALFILTVVALILTGVWINVLVSVLIGFAVVVLHAAFRSTDDLYIDEVEVFGGGLVSVVGGSPTKRTGFTRM